MSLYLIYEIMELYHNPAQTSNLKQFLLLQILSNLSKYVQTFEQTEYTYIQTYTSLHTNFRHYGISKTTSIAASKDTKERRILSTY